LELPLIEAARERGLTLTNDSQIFLEAAPCKVVGITGSAGKTTTTALLGQMAAVAAGQEDRQNGAVRPRRAWVGGNIGTPLLSVLDHMESQDLAVMELSSFQLELMTRSPQFAAVLNLSPNHLDRHGTLAAYTAAKARVLDFQRPQDVAVLGADDSGAWNLVPRVQGRLFAFSLGRLPEGLPGAFLRKGEIILRDEHDQESALALSSAIRLRGQHNVSNVLAACALGLAAMLPSSALKSGLEGFTGLPHRLEFVRHWGGADWYNDSIATAPERSAAAIRAFRGGLVLLAGGRDKDLPWEDLATLIRDRVDHVVAFGEAAGLVEEAVGVRQPGQRPYTLSRCRTLQQAVQTAAALIKPGDTVLFSPGGTSFDEFRDFEERGDRFRQWVMELS
jgi:UDP-N-acetylmuramoylalanine--D-glutamate ligase